MYNLSLVLSRAEVLYIGVVLIGGLLLFAIGRSRLRAYHREIRSQLQTTEHISKIPAEPAPKDGEQHQSIVTRGHRRLRELQTRFRLAFQLLFVLFWLGLLALPFLGTVPAAYLSFFLGTVSVLVGIAARPLLENVICGYVLLLGKAFKIGDTIIVDDKYGTIERISITHTTVKIWDWRRYIVPNSKMLSKEIVNYTLNDSWVWAYVEFWVAVDTDIDLVEKLALEAMSSSEYLAGDEPPSFWLMGIEKEGVKVWVAGWADSPLAAWMLQHDARRALCTLLAKHGIRTHMHSIETRTPMPQAS